ncbi:MAG: beta-propeller fold lactonase family protein, partial [Erysipelotrichaceae bacterium]|nr:beta-propeller fold lactonase family protein [Erysipelotrichaceae bacterium]
MKREIMCGTYGKGEGNGIYRFFLEDGKLSEPELFCRLDSAKYITSYDHKIYSVFSNESGCGAAIIDDDGQIEASLIYESVPSCYICYDRSDLITANFHEGTFRTLKYENGTLTVQKTVDFQKEAGCHMIIPFKDRFFGICMNLDAVFIIMNGIVIKKIQFPEKSGPRHGIVSADGKYLFAVGELSNKLYALSTEDYSFLDEISLGEGGSPAAIRLYEDKIHISVRDADIICVAEFKEGKLKLKSSYSCGGTHPRDMITVDGYDICANLDSGSVTCIKEGEVT